MVKKQITEQEKFYKFLNNWVIPVGAGFLLGWFFGWYGVIAAIVIYLLYLLFKNLKK